MKILGNMTTTIPAPMLASPGGKPFTSPDWLYEIKFDGYRCLAGIGLEHFEGDSGRKMFQRQVDESSTYAALEHLPLTSSEEAFQSVRLRTKNGTAIC